MFLVNVETKGGPDRLYSYWLVDKCFSIGRCRGYILSKPGKIREIGVNSTW